MKNFNEALKSHKSVQLVRKGLNVMKEESGYYRRLFILCQFDAGKLFWLHLLFLLFVQIIFRMAEVAIWGEAFPHMIDPIVAGMISCEFVHAAKRLSDFLIKEALKDDTPALSTGLTVVHSKPE